jgi:hypothetical protein
MKQQFSHSSSYIEQHGLNNLGWTFKFTFNREISSTGSSTFNIQHLVKKISNNIQHSTLGGTEAFFFFVANFWRVGH